VSEKSALLKSLLPTICSKCLTRWLTALGVTRSSSAAFVTLRDRASASKVKRHWMGGICELADMLSQSWKVLSVSTKNKIT
jgi:hypothetical protein